MRLKDKVKETPKQPQDGKLVSRERGGGKKKKRLVLSRKEMASLVDMRVSTLQGAKIGADGLASVLGFVGEECGELESTPDTLLMGLEEVARTIHRSLERETNALERAVWAFSDTQGGLALTASQKVEAILAARKTDGS